jgi:hypothetical protein
LPTLNQTLNPSAFTSLKTRNALRNWFNR